MPKILVIDDDAIIRDMLESFLQTEGFEVFTASDGKEGISLLKKEGFDLILSDLVMPNLDGLEVLKSINALNLKTPLIVMTAFGTIQTAVEAMKHGAFDYITKPFNLNELSIIIKRALNISKIQIENVLLKKQLKKKYTFEGLIGDSPKMQQVFEMIEKIADTDSTILITGESGTGKELIARTIHFNSSRVNKAFVPVNCAAIPKDLLESELFGHEKGAFTGAIHTRIGRFELAHGGTLFLDEIGELEPSLQAKLLRVLQQREFERVGGLKTIKVDVRIIAATNKNLEKCVKEGKFREDLYYRLNVIPIHLPPLRERTEDIPLLIDHFIKHFCKKKNRPPFSFTKEAMKCLYKYSWQGNVRELENLIERLSILVSSDVVTVSDLPDKFHMYAECEDKADEKYVKSRGLFTPELKLSDDRFDFNKIISDIERNIIIEALEKSGGVKSKAASLLGLNRTTLIEKMKKMGIDYKK
ncbi:MAG: sigma-54 dependent transcriptional regulator [Thermodesulfovibrionales bacterium]|nr:sigma-54 dependent transcriptional regulator [Thermodesulfovibrionales bacterium]